MAETGGDKLAGRSTSSPGSRDEGKAGVEGARQGETFRGEIAGADASRKARHPQSDATPENLTPESGNLSPGPGELND
ncbi:hypothetical protein D3C87_2106850 [compost metagenome]